jgi:DNA-binding IclR family transcriptional regulator
MVKDRIIKLLRSHPQGLTSSEVAAHLGATTQRISSPLSKLVAYGIIARTEGRALPTSTRRMTCRVPTTAAAANAAVTQ